MSHPTDQSTTGSQKSMGASDSKSQASKGQKPEKLPFVSTKYKQMYAYLITALRNCGEDTRAEFSDSLQDLDLEDVEVEKECRRLESISDE